MGHDMMMPEMPGKIGIKPDDCDEQKLIIKVMMGAPDMPKIHGGFRKPDDCALGYEGDKSHDNDGILSAYHGAMDDITASEGEPDWKSIAKQLLQAISMIDTHTDGVNAGTEKPEGALQAIDNETSRILWGKQEASNPSSSYQNANYSEHAAAGLMMGNEGNDKDNDDMFDVDKFKQDTDTDEDKRKKGESNGFQRNA